ncbi:MAG TPA: transketolase C-terminal domain-containing protein [Magnetospirillum sp.]|nr:transketolase C-terminal domain-containing protein [Magnetospirillum sp.]
MPEPRILRFADAVNEALDLALERDPRVWVLGEGVADPRAIFGTTRGLAAKYGLDRVMETPVAENGMTGIALGAALMGERPVIVHQRVDFSLYSFDQLINNCAKWLYMSGGKASVPVVVRMVVGRGWGQGPQHSQSLESVFAHIPGLKVVMPVTAGDAKAMLLGAIEDPNPVIFIEHRWLHGLSGAVAEGWAPLPLSAGPRLARPGEHVTIAATSYMVIEALAAAEALAAVGISAEIVDIRVLRPLDDRPIIESVERTGALLCVDTGWQTCGFGAEVVARVVEKAFPCLKAAPRRLGCPDHPSPASRSLTQSFYPRAEDIFDAVLGILGRDDSAARQAAATFRQARRSVALDQPDPAFTGPF